MTDNLPPLPKGDITYYITDSTMRRMECDAHSDGQMQAYARAAIDAAMAARGAVPAGWVMVPKDPTLEMLKAGHAYGYPPNIWAAMINSAPVAAAPQQVAQPSEPVCWACDGTGIVTTSSNGSGLIEAPCPNCAAAPQKPKD